MNLHIVASLRRLPAIFFVIAALSLSVRGSSEPTLEDLWGSDVSISYLTNATIADLDWIVGILWYFDIQSPPVLTMLGQSLRNIRYRRCRRSF